MATKKRKETTLNFFAAPSAKKIRHVTPNTTSKQNHQDIIIISDDDEVTELGPCPATRSNSSGMSVFEIPTLLSENKPDLRLASASHESYINEPPNVTSSSKDHGAQYDDWGLGDDEGFFQDADENEDDEVKQVNVELCQGNYDAGTTACPVCEKNLDGLFISVNHGYSLICKLSHRSLMNRKSRNT